MALLLPNYRTAQLHHAKCVGDLYRLYGLNSINSGKDIPALGRKLLLFFDCAPARVLNDADGNRDEWGLASPVDTPFGPVNSRIIARFLQEILSDTSMNVHIVVCISSQVHSSSPIHQTFLTSRTHIVIYLRSRGPCFLGMG